VLSPSLELEITFFTAEEGGRSMPPQGNMYGCTLSMENGLNLDCRLFFLDLAPRSAGCPIVAKVMFLSPDLAQSNLRAGTKFRILEGRVVGNGIVTNGQWGPPVLLPKEN